MLELSNFFSNKLMKLSHQENKQHSSLTLLPVASKISPKVWNWTNDVRLLNFVWDMMLFKFVKTQYMNLLPCINISVKRIPLEVEAE